MSTATSAATREIAVGLRVIRKGDAREGFLGAIGTVEQVRPGDPMSYHPPSRQTRAYVHWRRTNYRDWINVASLVAVDEAPNLTRKGPTPAMLKTLEEWKRRVGAEGFNRPWDVFSERGNVATAHRNNCEKLIRDGLLVPDRTDIGTAMRAYRPKAEAAEGVPA